MKTTALLTLIVCFTAAAVGADGGIVETLKKKYSGDQTIVADFDLTILWKVREKQETKSGRLQLAPGDKFRVELGPTTWVCNGQTVWQYNNKANQVVIKRLLDYDLSQQPSQILSTFVNGYEYEVLEQNDRQAILQWEADSSDTRSFYRTVTIYYDMRKQSLSSLILVDRHGNESTYLFKRTAFGEDIPQEVFEFEIPKGVHVLDDRS
ncbi:MAG: hypothetical protein GF331_05175 [Chitinivibrionales bacterium]|nr:hypothetical protein [Chitinivibrionales bacterium]